MCGIAGIVSLSPARPGPSREALLRMAGTLGHRGPDEQGIYRQGRAGFAHTRLSIIDLSSGQQPMCNEDSTLWLVFNGEIFNYIELRAELVALGHVFRTQSDTEVIIHAYEAWGDDAFARFNGQFAVALWDEKSGELVLARDRMAILPLYIAEHRGSVLFASECKALFAGEPELSRELDPVGLEQTFTFWHVVPPQSVFRAVSELRPGWVRRYDRDGRKSEHPYWSPRFPVGERDRFRGDLGEAEAAVSSALERATSMRMLRADVPVASYLSGGLDSSLLASLALRAKGANFATFSIRFQNAEHDETAFQRQMVERLGSEHHDIVVSESEIAAVMPDVIRFAERPVLRTAPAPLFLLSKLVREHGVKVVLTGEGADEVFAGYDLFREGKVRRFWARHPQSQLRPRLLERLYPYLARSPVAQRSMARQFFGRGLEHALVPGFAHQTRWQTTGALKRLFAPAVRAEIGERDVVGELLADLPADLPRWDPLAQDQYLEIRTLLAGYLLSSQGDRMLMAHSVEGRFPYLDSDVIELGHSLPASYKLKVLDEKHVLKRVAKDWVPESILARKKQPYRAPDATCFVRARPNKDAPAWIAELSSESALAQGGVFDPRATSALFDKWRTRSDPEAMSNADNMAIVGVLSTQLLIDALVNKPPQTSMERAPRTLIER
jgi:asparagine synthase (glutamine-hydrolysing)